MSMMTDQENEGRSLLLDALPAIAWSASAQTFRFSYVSPASQTILGYPPQRWLDEPAFWNEHLHPDDRHIPALCHCETLAGRNHELVYRMIAADGRTVWLRDYVNVHMVDGVPKELFGVMVDITREREAELASIESRENFRRMVELSPDCIGVCVDQTYVYVNQAFVQLLGAKSEAEIVGRNVFSFVDRTDWDLVRARMELLEAGQSVPYMREKYLRIDRSPLHVEVAALPLRYGDRDAVQLIARDITDRVRAEQELKARELENIRAQQAIEASEQRYRELVEDVSDILYTLDLEGRFVSLSRSFERSTGYRIEEWIGRPFAELLAPRFVDSLLDHFAKTTAGDGGIIREYALPSRSGSMVTVEVSSHPRYVDGMLAGTIGMARDVTEYRNIARKLEDAKRMSSLGQVATSLAHEFNNVLMSIQPFVEVVERQATPSRAVSDALDHITRAIGRGKRASQEILRFANPKEPQLSSIDVQSWMPTLLGQLVAALPSEIALSSSLDPDVRFVRGDCEHLDQVITNLVFNARDAIAGTGTIHVAVSLENEDFVRISVSDDGCGIPPHVLEQVFEPLYTTKRNGTGLGLAIARRLIEGHGGTLTAENRPEGGCTFHILIGAGAAPAQREQQPASVVPGVTRVLLVEDDLSVGTGLEALLNLEGFETTWVRAAGEAPEAARRTRPQVAIIDVNLPDGSGLDLVPVLRAEQQDLPVVLSTGHVELNLSNQKDRILSLMKPYELDDLLGAIASVVAAPAMQLIGS